MSIWVFEPVTGGLEAKVLIMNWVIPSGNYSNYFICKDQHDLVHGTYVGRVWGVWCWKDQNPCVPPGQESPFEQMVGELWMNLVWPQSSDRLPCRFKGISVHICLYQKKISTINYTIIAFFIAIFILRARDICLNSGKQREVPLGLVWVYMTQVNFCIFRTSIMLTVIMYFHQICSSF